MSRRALVLGGSGAVGSAVVRALVERGVDVVFTYLLAEERAASLARETGARAVQIDLFFGERIEVFLRELVKDGAAPDVLIHCAGTTVNKSIGDLLLDSWDEAIDVGGRAAFIAVQALAPSMAARGGGDIVFVGALDRAQSLPLPIEFAAVQGMLSAMAMAMAKELGPRGIRVNVMALGLLDEGIGQQLDRQLIADYLAFSALRRLGTAAEAARAIAWLALENTYLNGKTIPVNGGI